MANLTDGILAEGGFATWNPRPNTTSRFVAPPKTSPDKFSRQVRFVRNMQRHGKAFFAINEWGAGADYGLNPSEVPYNITGPHNRGIRQFVTAAYMMVNGGSAGVFLEDLLRRHFFRLVHVFQTRAVKTKLAGLKKRLSDWADDSHSHHTVQ